MIAIIHIEDKSYEVIRARKIHYDDAEEIERMSNFVSSSNDIKLVRDDNNYYICEEIKEAKFTEIKEKAIKK